MVGDVCPVIVTGGYCLELLAGAESSEIDVVYLHRNLSIVVVSPHVVRVEGDAPCILKAGFYHGHILVPVFHIESSCKYYRQVSGVQFLDFLHYQVKGLLAEGRVLHVNVSVDSQETLS